MQVSYKILFVIRLTKIKQTKKHWVVSVVSFTQLRALTGIMSHPVRFTANTQITNFSFQVLVRRKSLFFNFLDSTSIFLLSEWKHIFLGAPSQDRTSFFPCYWTTFLDAFLKKRMAAPMQLGSRKGVLNAGKKFVIELYVIRSWWKIKFKNKREIHQLVFSPLH